MYATRPTSSSSFSARRYLMSLFFFFLAWYRSCFTYCLSLDSRSRVFWYILLRGLHQQAESVLPTHQLKMKISRGCSLAALFCVYDSPRFVPVLCTRTCRFLLRPCSQPADRVRALHINGSTILVFFSSREIFKDTVYMDLLIAL